jgi:hypothetical protein
MKELRSLRAVKAAFVNQESLMDWDRIKGRWKQVGGQAKQKWGKLRTMSAARWTTGSTASDVSA